MVITHADVVHFVRWAVRYFGIGPEDRISGHPPLHFALSTFDVYGTMAAGAQIHLLPPEVSCNEMLLHLCRKLIAPDPSRRFSSALAADLDRKGAADFHRQLVMGDLASEYENDLRVWLEQLR